MATVRGRKKAEVVEKPAQALLDAFKFISIAQKKTGDYQYSAMQDGTLTAGDGVLYAGVKIQENISAFPHTHQMIAALSKCESTLVIAQVDEDTLAVTSGDFKALVACKPPHGAWEAPDVPCAVVSDALKLSLHAAATFTLPAFENPVRACVRLQAGSCVGTDGYTMIEHWHGIDLPPGLHLPRASALAVAKCKKPLKGFGFTQSSVTFYFEDDSFIKTRLYNVDYPNIELLFKDSKPSIAWEIPARFFDAVSAINSFSENGTVYFEDEIMLSREEEVDATTYKVAGLPNGLAFDCKLLARAKPWFKSAHFDAENRKAYFYDTLARGVIMGRTMKAPEVPRQTPEVEAAMKEKNNAFAKAHYDKNRKDGMPEWSEMDDDIPF